MFDSEVLKDPEAFKKAVFLQAVQREDLPLALAKQYADKAVELFEWNLNKKESTEEVVPSDPEVTRLGLVESEFSGKLEGTYEGINFTLYPGSFSAPGYPEWDIIIAGRGYGDSDQYGCRNLEQTVAKVHELIRTNHLNKE